jgi:multiple sugar transport system permease protein
MPSASLLLSLLITVVLTVTTVPAYAATPETVVTVTSRYNTQTRQPLILRQFFARHPGLRLEQWDGIRMPEEGARASLAMAMAANIGPDIFETDIRQAVAQGLAYPLTEWIGEDGLRADGRPKLRPDGKPDHNGQIDADEAKWDGWMKLKPLFRQVVTVDGKPYALPNRNGTYVGVLYSKSLIRRAGLDPDRPPRTWDDFARWCRKLYDPQSRVFGAELTPASWAFAPWVAASGSSIVVQNRRSPTTGKLYTFGEQETRFRAADTGEDLTAITPTWRCNVASPEAAAAVGFYHRLRWTPWVRDPATGEPLELTAEARSRGWVERQGRRITFRPQEVIGGSVAVTTGELMDTLRRLGRDLAMYPLWAGDMTEFENQGIQPDDLGMFPFPARTLEQKPVLQASNSFFMLGKDVLRRGGKTPEERRAYRNLVWEIMTLICSVEGQDEEIRRKAAAGQARFLNPRDLQRLGFEDYLREMPPENRRMWDQIERGEIGEVIEPYMGKWLQFRDFYQREVIDLTLRPSGKNFDYQAAFERPASALEKYRPQARLAAAGVVSLLGLWGVLAWRAGRRRKRESTAGVYRGWLPWALLAPALLSIAVWGYYPLLRGLLMAFEEYRIVGKSPWVGLDNFISIALDPNFYQYLLVTFRFVFWNLALAFFTPILLAFLLAEVPSGKGFFRTLYFLPQMTSGLVVTLMWKEMFRGNASGTLNRVFSGLFGGWGFQPVDWLGNPQTVMACVILPGVWAATGIGSLIYLAALKSVPEELYEAASLDGAGVFRKVWHISLPTIAPLVLINFVGAFIATFQSMGSIFLLTFGGPGKETMVLGMAIWQEAYVNLRFSLATSYAWILGSLLLGFTYLQLRMLRRVDFRQAKSD